VKTLITGGTGFVGKAILEAVRYTNSLGTITIAARNRPQYIPSGTAFCQWNLLDSANLSADFDLIIHAATPVGIDLTNPSSTYENSLLTMSNLISFAEQHGRPPRILFASSGAVYGDSTDNSNLIEESWDRIEDEASLSEYGRGKLRAEELLRDASKAGKCVSIIARMFTFSGRFLPQDQHFAIGNFVSQAMTNNRIVVRSDGQSIRSYLDSADMASWLITSALKGPTDFPLHIGSENSLTIADVANLVAEVVGNHLNRRIHVEILGQQSAIDGFRRYVPSTELTRRELLVRETVKLEDSITNMLESPIS
jgi:dTDP-glucose 4,6-dehydratase